MSGGEAGIRLGLRRPMGYFGAFNKWWSDFFLQNGRRPNKTDIETWRSENPSWRPELTLEEIVQHSKGRRDPEKNRQYFVEYRRKMRGSSNRSARRRGRGRRPASKTRGDDDPWEAATSDDGESDTEGDDDITQSSSPKRQPPRRCRAHGPVAEDATGMHELDDRGNCSPDMAEEAAALAVRPEQGIAPEGSDAGHFRAVLRGELEGAAEVVLDGPSSTAAPIPLDLPQALNGETHGVVTSLKIPVRRSRGPTSALARQLRQIHASSAELPVSGNSRPQPADSVDGLHTLCDEDDGQLRSLAPEAAAATTAGTIVTHPAAADAAACPFGAGAAAHLTSRPAGHDASHPVPSLPCVEPAGADPTGRAHVHHCTLMQQPVGCLPFGLSLVTIGPELGPDGPVPLPWWPGCPGERQCWVPTALMGARPDWLRVAQRPSAPPLGATSEFSGVVLAGSSDACASTLPFCDNDLHRTGSSGSISTCQGAIMRGPSAGALPIGRLPSGSTVLDSSGLVLGTPHTAIGSSSNGNSSDAVGALASPTASAAGATGAAEERAPPPAKRQRLGDNSPAPPQSHAACPQHGASVLLPDVRHDVPAGACRTAAPPPCRPVVLPADGSVASDGDMSGAPCGLVCGRTTDLGTQPAAVSSWTVSAIAATALAGPSSWWAGGLGAYVAPPGCIQGPGGPCADPIQQQPSADPMRRQGCCGLQLGWSDAERVWVDSLFADGQAELGTADTQLTGRDSAAVEELPGVDSFVEDCGDAAAWADLLAQDLWGGSPTDAFSFVECM